MDELEQLVQNTAKIWREAGVPDPCSITDFVATVTYRKHLELLELAEFCVSWSSANKKHGCKRMTKPIA